MSNPSASEAEKITLRKKFLQYLFPSVAAMWVFSLYTMIDGIFVSRGVGPDALSAVNISMPFISFIFAISLLFSTGASTIIAMDLGKGNFEQANKTFTQIMVVLSLLSLIILLFSILNLDKIVVFLGATGNIIPLVKDYLKIIIIFGGFFTISYSLEVLVKTDGFPQFAIIGVSLSALMNVVLDYYFIIQMGWGIKGAAYATGISQLASSIFFLIHFIGNKSRLQFTKFTLAFPIIKKIMGLGFADFLTEFSTGIVIYIFNHTILKQIGPNGLITYSIISYISTLIIMTMVGITQGMQPLSSFYYGKGNKKYVRRLLKLSLKVISLSSLFIFIVLMLFTDSIVSIFISSTHREIFDYSIKALRLFAFSFLILGFNINISGFLASVEKPLQATIISLGRGLVIIVASLLIMTYLFGAKGIWASPILSEGLCLLISLVILKKTRPAVPNTNLANQKTLPLQK